MANYGRVTKGFAPLQSFKEDIYAELEKPISTQNLDAVDVKIKKVMEEASRAYNAIHKTLNEGGQVSTKSIETLIKEARTAAEVLDFVNKKIEQFEKFSNAKTNFPEKYQDLYKLRNGLSSIHASAQLSVNDATGVSARQKREKEQRIADKEVEEKRRREEEERARASREARLVQKQKTEQPKAEQVKAQSESIVKSATEAKEAITAVIPDASQQKNGEEVLPTEQVKAQSESIVKSATEAKEAIQEVASGSIHTYTRKGEYFSNKSHSGWYANELKKMSDEELKEERERLQEDSKTRSYGSDEETVESSRIDNMLKWIDLEVKAREKLAKSRESSGDSKTSKGVVPKEQTEQEFNSLQELNEAIIQTQGELDALHQRTKDTGIIKEGDIEEARTLEKELSRLVATRKLLVGKNLAEKQQPQSTSSLVDNNRPLDIPKGKGIDFKAIASASIESISAIAKVFDTIVSGAKKATSAIADLVSSGFNILKSAVSTTLGNMQKLVSGGFNAVKSGANALKGAFNSIRSSMQSLVKKHTPNMMKSFASLKSMLMRRIKRTFISSIFNQAKEGLQSLAKLDSGFNKTMSNIKNGAKQASGNLAGLLGNIITALEPAIMTVINLLSDLFAKANAVIALITGKATVAVAKKSTDNYANSLKNASSAAKDLNHQLYGFDEITRQEDNNSSGSSGIQYEQQEVSGILGNLASIFEEIKQAFLNGEFRKVGQLIGGVLDDIVLKIDKWFVNIRPKATQWAKNIAEILNGIVDTDLFIDIGKTLGDGLNLIFDVVGQFLDQFDFIAFGEKIGLGIGEMFSTIEWETVGRTVALGFSSIWETLSGIFSTLPWGDIGQDFADGINSFFDPDNLNWDAHRDAVVNGINGVTKMLWRLVNGVKWGDIAERLGNHLNEIIDGINWTGEGGLSSLISSGIDNLLEAFDKLYDFHFFVNLASKIGETLHDVLVNNIDWKRLSATIMLGLLELRTAFWKLINFIDVPNLAKQLGNAINNLFKDEKVKEAWKESKDEAIKGIKDIAKTFSILVNGDEKGEGKIDFVKIGKDIGRELASMINAIPIEDVISNIGKLCIKLASAFFGLVTEIFEPTETTSLGERLANGINGIFKNSETGEIDTTNFEVLGETIGSAITNILENIANFLGGIDWDAFSNSLSTLFTKIPWTDILVKLFDVAKNFLVSAIRLVSGITQAVCDAIGTLDWGKIAKACLDFLLSGLLELVKSGSEIAGRVFDMLTGNFRKIAEDSSGDFAEVSEGIFGIKFNYELISQPAIEKRKEWVAQLREQIEKEKEEAIAQATAEIVAEEGFSDGSIEEEIAIKYDAKLAAFDTAFQDTTLELSRENFAQYVNSWLQDNGIESTIPIDEIPDVTVTEIPNWDSIKEQFAIYGVELSGAFVDSMKGKGNDDIKTCLDLIGRGVNQEILTSFDTKGISEKLNAWMTENGKSLNEAAVILASMGGQDVTELAKSLGVDVGEALGGIIPDSMATALGMGEKQVLNAKDSLVKAGTASATDVANANTQNKAFGETTEETAKAIEGKTPDVKEAQGKVHKTVTQEMEELPEEQKKNAEQMMKWIIQGVSENNETVVSAVEAVALAVVERAKEIMSSDVGLQIATDFLSGVKQGIIDNTSLVSDTLYDTIDYALQYGTRPFTNNNAYTIGRNLMVGFHNGMADWGYLLTEVMAEVCNTTIDTAREILGIASPSKVFAQIGEYTMEGMQIGLENEGKNAVSTVADLVDAMTETGEDSELGIMTDGLDTVADKLSRIANIFSDIADTITEMGGLRIPTIATGQVIPYRTQLGANPTSGGTDSMNIEDAIYSAFTRAMGTSGAEQDINITLQIDGRKMADIVSKYQRQQSRAWGV